MKEDGIWKWEREGELGHVRYLGAWDGIGRVVESERFRI